MEHFSGYAFPDNIFMSRLRICFASACKGAEGPRMPRATRAEVGFEMAGASCWELPLTKYAVLCDSSSGSPLHQNGNQWEVSTQLA